jgi:hypothetical protein
MTDCGSAKTATVPFRNQTIPNLERWREFMWAELVARRIVVEMLPAGWPIEFNAGKPREAATILRISIGFFGCMPGTLQYCQAKF